MFLMLSYMLHPHLFLLFTWLLPLPSFLYLCHHVQEGKTAGIPHPTPNTHTHAQPFCSGSVPGHTPSLHLCSGEPEGFESGLSLTSNRGDH